ncbi:fimbria/pilus outer membrane usher protein [Providencia stuartii]|uniref:Fimbrial biogenesis outer membrane usher protein n=1 Tax=Providencia stuartii TaxID=588 RepID=A0AAJ1JGG8_PROST|nr:MULTISPECIES: fimbria/pilus outer membrane usher protein [Providencia]AMG68094.1 fimbrial biogenesis outer membrane usher protein [Providencia stuartii]EMA3642335.1 fimbrial biogenesis outer membrane usher protein [Providencia stuartii]MBW3101465.1 fimbrial biogenesis outer membrane usher protein [Providencia stuartii]MCB5218346.1 fimbrial biogenesis outer membrane usher protein [Providencia stuartii]MDE5308366.1 fimbrial biogenesis outer membrane usher protein [Providencia stuartii]
MNNKFFKISLLSSLICLSLYSYGDDYFDPSMLESQLGIDPTQIDLSQFSASNSMPAGTYRIQVEVNRNNLGDEDITYEPNKQGTVVPVLTPAQLEKWGVNVKAIPKLNSLEPNAKIFKLTEYIDDATITSDMGQLTLKITIPQIAMAEKAQGYINPELLDDGIPALFFNYFLSGSKNRYDSDYSGSSNSDNLFGTVIGGLNLGPWRLRSNMSYSRSSGDYGSESTTDFNNTYVMRALHSIRSLVMIGEVNTNNEVFDSIPFKGIKLSSDDDMLPSSQRGYAPEVNGIAQSNARVTIRQNGAIVYQTYVAPGAFSLKDVYATGNAGDLDVTITEENGTEKTFTIAYSSLPVMLRPGGYRYETSAGRYNGGYTVSSKQSDFFLGSLIYGLPTDSTLYGGLLMAKDYFSVAAGVGISLGYFGALSADITHATADMGDYLGDKSGQSYRIRYSKSMLTTGTSIDLTALRYSSRSYFSFADFNNYDHRLKDNVAPWLNQRQRASFTTSITQSLGKYGSIFLSGSLSDYWEIDREVRQLSVGYNGNYDQINYSIRYSIDRVKDKTSWPENRQISINVSIPFSIFSNHEMARNMHSSYMFTQDNNNVVSQQLAVNGTFLDNKLSYGISQGYENKGTGSNGAVNASYSGSKGNVSAGYNYSKNTKSFNASLSGGLLVHSDGILLGRSMGNSMAIIEAPGATGAEVGSKETVINNQGYALYPYTSVYNANIINMDVNTLPPDVMLKETSKTVYPSAGSIVKVKFDTKLGFQTIINLNTPSGKPVPFGAVATLVENNVSEENTGIVGDNNQLFMGGLPPSGKLNISWGSNDSQRCTATFSGLDNMKVSESQPIRTISALCQ